MALPRMLRVSPYRTWPIVWIILWVVIAGMIVGGDDRSVTTAYRPAALAWVQGEDMYAEAKESGHGFLYFPHAAILYVPFAVLPEPAGDILWRGLGLLLLAAGIFRTSHILADDTEIPFGYVAFASTVLCVSCLRIGQSTLPMTGIMLLAVDAMYRSKWNSATAWLTLAVAIKPLAVVLVLLSAAVHVPMRLRLAVGMVVGALLPFVLQSPAYAAWQFQQCGAMLQVAAELGNESWWAQAFGMLKAFGLETPGPVQTAARLVAALATCAVCWIAFRRFDSRRAHLWLYTLTAVYLMLFNPRTENSTYCILGPALGCFLADEVLRRRPIRAWLLGALTVAAAGSYEIGKFFTPEGARPIWLAPLACLVFAAYLAVRYAEELAQETSSDEACDGSDACPPVRSQAATTDNVASTFRSRGNAEDAESDSSRPAA